jgi:hypothetical protein
MGKGLPGGRRQAGRIDYRTEPRSSLLPSQIATTARGVAMCAAMIARKKGRGQFVVLLCDGCC